MQRQEKGDDGSSGRRERKSQSVAYAVFYWIVTSALKAFFLFFCVYQTLVQMYPYFCYSILLIAYYLFLNKTRFTLTGEAFY